MLSHNDMMPLYQQIKERIKESILKEELKPGEKIQTELELISKYGVSRITVRNAISDLVEEGYLIKKQGKGTFVNKRKMEREIITFLSFTMACKAKGVKPSSKLIKRDIIEPTSEDLEELELVDEDKVIHIQRIRYADDEPIMIENNYFSYEKYKFLMEENLESSLYEILSKKYDINPCKSRSTIEIAKAGDEEVAHLKITKGSPLFNITATAYDVDNHPVHRSEQIIVGEKFKLSYTNGF